MSVLVLKTNFGHSESFEDKLKLYTVLEPDDRRKGVWGRGVSKIKSIILKTSFREVLVNPQDGGWHDASSVIGDTMTIDWCDGRAWQVRGTRAIVTL